MGAAENSLEMEGTLEIGMGKSFIYCLMWNNVNKGICAISPVSMLVKIRVGSREAYEPWSIIFGRSEIALHCVPFFFFDTFFLYRRV